jgi:hypothetical protein
MYGWAKEHYQGLIDVELATTLGKFRILLFIFNLSSFSRPLQCWMGWHHPTQKVLQLKTDCNTIECFEGFALCGYKALSRLFCAVGRENFKLQVRYEHHLFLTMQVVISC